MTVQQAQDNITSTEFLKWSWYLNWRDTKEFNRQDWYLAQIAADVTRGQVKHPKKVEIKHKILKFSSKQKQTQDPEEKMSLSKKLWTSVTGLIGNKKNQKKRKLPKRSK